MICVSYKKWIPVLSRVLRERMPEKSLFETHGADHVLRVWKRAEKLGKRLSADMDVLVAAVFLHDLGRKFADSEEHGVKSAEIAAPILVKIGFPKEKRGAVLDAIAKHDFSTLRSARKSVEAKILYDCDKMDAFGVIGVTRHLLFYAPRSYAPADFVRMVDSRWNGLCLAEGRRLARADYVYAKNFFKELRKEFGD